MRKHKVNFPGKLIFLAAISCIGIIILTGAVRRFLLKSDYFKIKEIIIKDATRLDLSHLKGRNIFSLSLQDEAKHISALDPAYKRVRVIRVLPNRIFVDLAKRNPVAYIKLYKYIYCVDEEMAIFEAPLDLEGQVFLPVILGLETKIRSPLAGSKYNLKELMLAVNIIKQAKQNNILKDFEIKRIDVANPNSGSLFIGAPARPKAMIKDLEVKFSQDILDGKLDALAVLFLQLKDEWDTIKYIDLRFKEPLMKFNE